jgi:membrane protein DedA with SNARE-associated domain
VFERWGTWVVAIGRLFAGIRGAMVVAAGATRFSFVKFVIVDGLAALVSGGLFICLGFWAGTKLGSISEMREKIKDYEHWVYLGIGLLFVAIVVIYWRRKRKHKPKLADVALEKAVEKAQEHSPKSSTAVENSAR